MNLQPLSKARHKLIRSLSRKKMRRTHGAFLAEGLRLVNDLAATPERVIAIYAEHDAVERLDRRLHGCEILVVDPGTDDLFSTEHPQGVGAIVSFGADHTPAELAKSAGPLLYLDGLSDPGNAGTILRAADWFGISGVMFGPESVDPFNPKAVRASMGGIIRLPVCSDVPPVSVVEMGRPIYALDMDGDAVLGQEALPVEGIFVIGNEAWGLSGFWREHSTTLSIPGSGTGESLNAAMAATLLCWELSRLHK